MSKKTKNASILCCFAKQRKEESREINQQETNTSRPSCSTPAFHSTQCDSTEERPNLDRPNSASDDMAMILPLNTSTNADKLLMLKNAALLKDNNFVI